jgi:hypothetical protein
LGQRLIFPIKRNLTALQALHLFCATHRCKLQATGNGNAKGGWRYESISKDYDPASRRCVVARG